MADSYKPVAEEPPPNIDRYDWLQEGQDELKTAFHMTQRQNWNIAKNVILFIGDGMASTTITAARVFKGQTEKVNGREALLEWELFPHTGLSRVSQHVIDQHKVSAFEYVVFPASVLLKDRLGKVETIHESVCSLYNFKIDLYLADEHFTIRDNISIIHIQWAQDQASRRLETDCK